MRIFMVKNAGKFDGDEVVQLYVNDIRLKEEFEYKK